MKKDLASSFEGLANRMVDSITDADILELDAYKRTLSGAIATDKCQLLRGLPTENINVSVLLSVARMLRDQERTDDENWQNTLPAPTPAPIALPALTNSPRIAIPAPVPVLASAKKAPVEAPVEAPSAHQSVGLAPGMRVKYYSPTPLPDDEDSTNPLTRGLSTR